MQNKIAKTTKSLPNHSFITFIGKIILKILSQIIKVKSSAKH